MKYIGKDVLKAVVRKETLCTPKKYRRLMEWRGRVSGSEETVFVGGRMHGSETISLSVLLNWDSAAIIAHPEQTNEDGAKSANAEMPHVRAEHQLWCHA